MHQLLQRPRLRLIGNILKILLGTNVFISHARNVFTCEIAD